MRINNLNSSQCLITSQNSNYSSFLWMQQPEWACDPKLRAFPWVNGWFGWGAGEGVCYIPANGNAGL